MDQRLDFVVGLGKDQQLPMQQVSFHHTTDAIQKREKIPIQFGNFVEAGFVRKSLKLMLNCFKGSSFCFLILKLFFN